jgi:hypothetical protein
LPTFEPLTGDDRPHDFPVSERFGVDIAPFEWKRTGTVLGAVLLGACVFGGLAGWWSASDVGKASPPEKAASVPLPTAKPITADTASLAAPLPVPVDAQFDRPRHVASAAERTPAERPRTIAEVQPQELQPEASETRDELAPQSEPVVGASDAAVAEPAAASTAAASMPLPNKVIARTIERIGYSCGSVASTNAIEGGAPGVYKITCTSGQSYQASPVNGRYRFRRLGRN